MAQHGEMHFWLTSVKKLVVFLEFNKHILFVVL